MPGTTIKAALKKCEETTCVKPSEATEIKLIGVYPPIGRIYYKEIWGICIISRKDGLQPKPPEQLWEAVPLHQHDHKHSEHKLNAQTEDSLTWKKSD